jgi:LacI family transcriptional regulator
MSINLKVLSARLGLSPTTVSRALSGYSDVSPTTRERVQQMARELGYQPNRAARQVALGRADAVGIVYPPDSEFLGNPSFRETLEGLAHALEQNECDLLLAAAPRLNELRVYDRMVRGRRVDALVVAHTLCEDPRIDYLRAAGFPFVAYGRTAQPDGFAWLDFDNQVGSRLAVQSLVALGHRRIAYVHVPLSYNFALQRHAGYLGAMAEAGIAADPALVVGGSLDRRAGYGAALELLALAQRPTAVIVDNNLGGVGLIRALLDRGVAIGSEMSVIVNEGVPEDTLFAGLTVAAVRQPTPYRSGQTLGEMALALAERKTLAPAQVLRQPEFVSGNSIGPPRR